MMFSRMTNWFADLIDHEAPADGPPPQKLLVFMHWCLRGSYRIITTGSFAYVCVGLSEVAVMVLLGRLADAAIDAGGLGSTFWSEHWMLVAGWFVLLLILRPVSFGLAS